jgi:hypothetical protein
MCVRWIMREVFEKCVFERAQIERTHTHTHTHTQHTHTHTHIHTHSDPHEEPLGHTTTVHKIKKSSSALGLDITALGLDTSIIISLI